MTKILLIEDDLYDQDIFMRLVSKLSKMDISTDCVTSLKAGVEKLDENKYDLIISDLGLPDCDGIRSLSKVGKYLEHTPLIILTGNDNDDLLEEASLMGVYDYIVKNDFTVGSLRRSIRYALKRFEAEQEKKNLENLLRQAQRIDSLGNLTGGIAHDFNNKLAIIQGNLQIMKVDLQNESMLQRSLEKIEKTVKVSASLTKQLLAFGRKQELVKESVNVNEVVVESLKLLDRVTGSNIQLKANLFEQPTYVEVDFTQVDQVIMNLVINACDAIGSKEGKVEISLSKVSLKEDYFYEQLNRDPGDYVRLSVTDNGCGIPEDVKDSVLEPYFTTKELNDGTGLGLSVVDGIVNQLGGFIKIESEVGVGTSVHIFFKESVYMEKQKEDIVYRRGESQGQRVLYVEDEEDLCEVVAQILESKGFEVTRACNGAEGLELFAKNPTEFDVILTDVIMPVMGGKELMVEARKINPDIGIVFFSGYSESELTVNGQFPSRTCFHSKPGDIEALVESLLRFCSLGAEDIKAA